MMTAEGFASALNFIVKALQKGNRVGDYGYKTGVVGASYGVRILL